jgi:hypothetical protein
MSHRKGELYNKIKKRGKLYSCKLKLSLWLKLKYTYIILFRHLVGIEPTSYCFEDKYST